MKKRFIAALMAAVMLAGLLPTAAFATSSDVVAIENRSESIIPTVDLPDNDELYDAYLQQLFYGDPGVSFLGTAAGEQLNTASKALYSYLKEQAAGVAAGEISSTVFTMDNAEMNAYGIPCTFETGDFDAAEAEFQAQLDMGNILNALLADCPYELYWFDKVSGFNYSYSMSSNGTRVSITRMTIVFFVAANYQDGNDTTFDTTKATGAKAAAAKAQEIVNDYVAASTRDKLVGYKDEICTLVSYNHNAANGGSFSANDDPWELIYVFDGDPATNVVCEGYSKAFQYLCDLGGLDCYSVDGTMADANSVGGHMWNIVRLDGSHYLADVTNSDSGTAGQDGSLFLAQGTPSSMDFTVTYGDGSKEIVTLDGYTVGTAGIFYTYDEATISLWGNSGILDISVGNTTQPEMPDTPVLPGGTCGENVTWTFDGVKGTLTISGTGAITDYLDWNNGDVPPWYDYLDKISTIVIEDGITSIGDGAFSYCTNLTRVTIPDSVTSIGSNAFDCCTSLESIVLPESITDIGIAAFSSCRSLTNITIPHSLKHIPDFCFNECENLTSVTIPEGVTSISGYAFQYCRSLESIEIPEGVTTIGEGAFTGCNSLSNVTLPESLTAIGSTAFFNCGLTSITIPANVTSIGWGAFYRCGALATVTFEGSAPEIDGYAFCEVTATVSYPANDATWTEAVMQDYGGTITWVPYGAVKLGDANGDGEIDFSDAVLVLEYSAFLIDGAQVNLSACDVNGDGFMDFSDAVLILEYSAFLITEFPAVTEN